MPTDGSIIQFTQSIPFYADSLFPIIFQQANIIHFLKMSAQNVLSVYGLGDDDVRLSKRLVQY